MELDEAAESCTIDGESPVVENSVWFPIKIVDVVSIDAPRALLRKPFRRKPITGLIDNFFSV